jgi:hypothetical protein
MEICFAVLLNSQTTLKWDSWAMRLNNICLIYLALCLIAYPVWLIYVLCSNYDNLDSPDLDKYGEAFADIKKDRKISIIIPILNLMRRLLLVALLIFYTSSPNNQIFIFMLIQLMSMIFIGLINRRFVRSGKEIEFMNDCSIMIMLYHMLLFTDYLHNNEMRYKIGFALSGFIILLLIPQLV